MVGWERWGGGQTDSTFINFSSKKETFEMTAKEADCIVSSLRSITRESSSQAEAVLLIGLLAQLWRVKKANRGVNTVSMLPSSEVNVTANFFPVSLTCSSPLAP